MVENFTQERQELRNLMPQYMKTFEHELSKVVIPNLQELKKEQYISGWADIFDDSAKNFLIDKLKRYRKIDLETAFIWIQKHFAELDLGGNYKWVHCSIDVLKLLKKSQWNAKSESDIIKKYISDTRWYEE